MSASPPYELATEPEVDLTGVPECQDCGACCFSDSERYVFVWGGDHAQLTRQEQRSLTLFEGTHCFMRMSDEGCCAAQGVVEGKFTCSIYPRRPMLCHELQRGDAACEAARELYGAKARAWRERRTS